MRATAFEPAAAAPIATPTIHCSSIGHPRPDVRVLAELLREIQHFAGRQRRRRRLVLVEEHHVGVRAHFLGDRLELRVVVRFFRHGSSYVVRGADDVLAG